MGWGLNPSYSSFIYKESLCITFTPNSHHHNVIDLSKWVYYTPIIVIGPSFLPKELTTILCDDLFNRGYKDAQLHRDELLAKFKSIGIKL